MGFESSNRLIERLAGSLKTPKNWRRKSADQIITKAKKEYFLNKELKTFDEKVNKLFT